MTSPKNSAAAISMIGNILSEFLESLPNPFVFEGYEGFTETHPDRASLLFVNDTHSIQIRIIEQNGDLVIQDTTIWSLASKKHEITLENNNGLGIVEYLDQVLLPQIL